MANDVIGAIRDKWLAFGGAAGYGEALDVERPTFDGAGRIQSFAAGKYICWHPELGAFAVYGAIAAKWNALGGPHWGYPITDESPCPDHRGRFNHFRAMHLQGHPDSSIYWTPETGANEVHGAIRGAWAQEGWERGRLGYPRSDEMDGDPGTRRSNFEHGFIVWSAAKGVRVHGPVRFDDN